MAAGRARAWHALTALVAATALGLQFALVVNGSAVLVDVDPPSLPVRLLRLASYFTVQSNLLVLLSVLPLVRDPAYDGAAWRVVRAAAVAGITVTGVVHYLLLRPLLDLDGADLVADRLLHVVVPVLAVAGWLALGPWPRLDGRVLVLALVWPLVWLAAALLVGLGTGWFPYPFLDVGAEGWTAVGVTCLVVTALFVGLLLLMRGWDLRAGGGTRTPTPEGTGT